MDFFLSLILFILCFLKTQQHNSTCVTNEVYDFDNKTEKNISSKDFQYLDRILKKHEHEKINLILSAMSLKNLEDVKINNYFIKKLDLSINFIQIIPDDIFSRLKYIKEINLNINFKFDKFVYKHRQESLRVLILRKT